MGEPILRQLLAYGVQGLRWVQRHAARLARRHASDAVVNPPAATDTGAN